MTKLFKQIHRYLGFPIGLLFLLTFGTGLLTAVDELMSRELMSTELASLALIAEKITGLKPDELNSDSLYRELTIAEIALAISELSQRHQSIRQIIIPSQKKPFYQVISQDKNWIYSSKELRLISEKKITSNPFFSSVLQLHRNFMLGKQGLFGIAGQHFVAWVSLLALLISILGLWLWWPMRKKFKPKNMLPVENKRKNFYLSHTTSGVVVFLLIVLMSLTGISITYRSLTQSLLGVDKTKTEIQQKELANNWTAWLVAAQQAIPDGKLINIRFLPKKNLFFLYFKTPEDWLGLVNSKVSIDHDLSMMIDHSVFKDLSLGEKIISLLKPLHTGRNLPSIYILLLLIMSALGVLMVFSGLVSFVLKYSARFGSIFPIRISASKRIVQ